MKRHQQARREDVLTKASDRRRASSANTEQTSPKPQPRCCPGTAAPRQLQGRVCSFPTHRLPRHLHPGLLHLSAAGPKPGGGKGGIQPLRQKRHLCQVKNTVSQKEGASPSNAIYKPSHQPRGREVTFLRAQGGSLPACSWVIW